MMKLVFQEELVLAVTGGRLNKVIESLGAERGTQRGSRGNQGCIDAIFNLRLALRERKERGHASWVAFLDLRDREMLWVALRKLGCPGRFVARTKALHDEVIVLVRKGDAEIRAVGGHDKAAFWGLPFSIFVWLQRHWRLRS